MLLRGIDGANPLGFLAAVGAFRLMDGLWSERNLRMRWVQSGAWRPEVGGLPVTDEAELCRVLNEQGLWAPLETFERLGNNLTVATEVFEGVVRDVAAGVEFGDRRAADFVAAFGSEVFRDERKPRIQITELCFITGSGRQDFLGTAGALARRAGPAHLQQALFGPWRYEKGLSMRWDPGDAKEYALQWGKPADDGATAVWGANRLAFEALPVFPTVPTKAGLRTTSFTTRNGAHEFTWPVWTEWASADTVRSLVSLRHLEEEQPDRAVLAGMGLGEVFRAPRVRIGPGKNFKVSFRPARAV